jgi:hypothetical protein
MSVFLGFCNERYSLKRRDSNERQEEDSDHEFWDAYQR